MVMRTTDGAGLGDCGAWQTAASRAAPIARAARGARTVTSYSEDQLERELHLAARKRLRRFAEVCVREVGSDTVRRAVQIRRIENVERFGAELDPRRAVRHLECFEQREVGRLIVWAAIRVARQIAKRPAGRAR